MKSSNIIKLLSVLLCVVLMLASCGETAAAEPNVKALSSLASGELPTLGAPMDDATAPAPLTREDFIEMSPADKLVLGEAEKLDMELVYITNMLNNRALTVPVALFRSSEVDAKNVVTETWSVYNLMSGEAVLEIKNTHDNVPVRDDGYYYVDSEVYIRFDSQYLITVCYVENSLFTEEEIENNFRLDEYSIKSTERYEYYDLAGNLVCKSNNWQSINGRLTAGDMPYYLVSVGNKSLKLDMFGACVDDAEECEMNFLRADYDNESYAYFFYTETIWGSSIQIFDKKSGALVLQRNFYDDEYDAFVLENGNVLVQNISRVVDPLADYNIVYNGDKANLTTFIIDVKTGTETEIESNYIFDSVISATEYQKMIELMKLIAPVSVPNFTFSDKVVNIAMGHPIANKNIDDSSYPTLFLNNDGSVAFSMTDGSLMNVLSDGTCIYYNDTSANASYKIVRPDGTSYLINDATDIYDGYLIIDSKVYDLDRKLIVDVDTIGDGSYAICTVLGDAIILERTDDSDYNRYIAITLTTSDESEAEEASAEESSPFEQKFILSDERIISVDMNGNYITTRNTETGLVTVYNAELTPVFARSTMPTIFSRGNAYYCRDSVTESLYVLKLASQN